MRRSRRQFISLLSSAADGMAIHLSLYILPDVPRNEASNRHTAAHYSMPQVYFDRDTVVALDALQLRSESRQDDELSPAISAALSYMTIENTWRSSATGIYKNPL